MLILTEMAEKKRQKPGVIENFALVRAVAIIFKMAAAPIEHVKLMVQNQDEMLKAGRLKEPYKELLTV